MSRRIVACSADVLFKKCVILKFSIAMLLLGLCILSSGAKAQVLYGVLTGNVTDPSSAAVPDAQVEALNMATGVSRQTTADSAGIYRFAELHPGIYRVTVCAARLVALATENGRVEANKPRMDDVPYHV